MQQISDEIVARKDWIGVDWLSESSEDESTPELTAGKLKKTVRLLDYACGTGLVSRVLSPFLLS